MQVAEILRRKGYDVATVAPTDSVGEAVELLREHRIGALVVTADGSRIDGIVSERDIVRALGHSPTDLLSRPTSDIMTAEVFTCSPDDRVEQLMSMMTDKRIRHLPVAMDGMLNGIISIGDVVKSRLFELEQETQALEEYIQHGR
jgi:CBS domain-containing protein